MHPRRAHPKLIAFVGPMGSGKSTLAKALQRHIGGKIISFAGPLKKAAEALQIPHENVYGTPEQKAQPLQLLCGKSSRQFMQLLGTEFGRNMIGDDFWLRQFEQSFWAADCDYVFCDDLRFLNEAALVRKLGGTIARVVRHEQPVSLDRLHASEIEQAQIDADCAIHNTGTAAALHEDICELFGAIQLANLGSATN